MAAETLATADAILKEDYQPLVREQLNNANAYSAQLKRNSKSVSGRRAVLALHTSYNEGVGAIAEDGTIPTAGTTGWTDELVPTYTTAGRFEISTQLLKAAVSDTTSFVRGLAAKTDDLKKSAARDYNRQLFGTSDGVIIQLTTTTASTTVQLNSSATDVQRRQLRAGMVIDIGTVASPATVATVTIVTAPVAGGTTFVVSAAVTTTASHFVFRTNAGGAIGGAGQKELTGLQSIVDSSGTLHGVNPSSFPVWVSTETAVGGAISELVLERAVDAVDIASGSFPNLMITSHGVRRAYAAALQTNKRIVNEIQLKGGFSGVEIATPQGTAALTVDRDCPIGMVFGLSLDKMQEYTVADWEFMDMDGATLSRVPNKLNYEATLYKISEQATDQRNAHFKLTGVTES